MSGWHSLRGRPGPPATVPSSRRRPPSVRPAALTAQSRATAAGERSLPHLVDAVGCDQPGESMLSLSPALSTSPAATADLRICPQWPAAMIRAAKVHRRGDVLPVALVDDTGVPAHPHPWQIRNRRKPRSHRGRARHGRPSAAPIRSSVAAQSRLDPSMSVNRNFTVAEGTAWGLGGAKPDEAISREPLVAYDDSVCLCPLLCCIIGSGVICGTGSLNTSHPAKYQIDAG